MEGHEMNNYKITELKFIKLAPKEKELEISFYDGEELKLFGLELEIGNSVIETVMRLRSLADVIQRKCIKSESPAEGK